MNTHSIVEHDLTKPANRSKLLNIIVHAIASVCGTFGFLSVYLFGGFIASRVLMEFSTFVIIYLSLFFITFSILGALFGYFQSSSGWKLGLSLASLPVIFWSLIYLIEALSSEKHFPEGVKIFHYTLPILVGGCLGAYLGSKFKVRRKF